MAKNISKEIKVQKGLEDIQPDQNKKTSKEVSVFVEKKESDRKEISPSINAENANSTLSDQEIIKEIEKVMQEGSYKERVVQPTETEDDDRVKVFRKTNLTDDFKKAKEDSARQTRKEKREAKKAAYKKTTFKHKLKVMGVLSVLAVFIGSGLGVWYFDNFLKSNVDYSADPADFVQSIDETLTRNLAGINLADKEEWVSFANSKGKTPLDFSPTDNFVLAQYNASIATSYEALGQGYIKTMGQNQFLYSERKFDGNKYSFVSISPSTMPSLVADVAVCDIMAKGANTIKSYQGPILEGNKSANWAYTTSYAKEDYGVLTGVEITDLHPYIVSEKAGYETVISSSEVTQGENGNYVFTLELDKINGVLKYVRQVKRTGGLAFLPEFSSIVLTVTITPDWQLSHIHIEEKYSAIKMGVNAPINATQDYDFIFNKAVTLPSVQPAV